MKKQLITLYKCHWEDLSTNLIDILNDEKQTQKPTNPLLINLNESLYQDSDIKVLIFGQETNDWENDFNGSTAQPLATYEVFYNSGKCFKTHGGHFWNGYNKFLKSLNEKFEDKKVCAVWNNVIKVGVSGTGNNKPNKNIYNVEKENFNIMADEINILNPDIILFLSGPDYDNEIRNALPGVEFNKINDEFTVRQLSKLSYKNHKNIYRTYHPNYLWRNDINKYFNNIINDLKL